MNQFARIQITDKTMRASRSNRGAFVNLLEADLEDALTDSKDNLARQIYGDGTGKMAMCTAQTSQTVLVVSSVQFFAEGQIIDIIATDNSVKYAAREIVSVDDVTTSITISGTSVTTLTSDFVVISGSLGMEISGFGAVFTNDNTYLGVNRANNKWFNSTNIAVGGEISEIILQKASDEADRKAGGNVNFYATSYGVRRAYQNLLLATKQIVNVMKLEGGWETLAYNGKPFTADKYAPASTLFGLDLSTWKQYELSDWDWLSTDGAVLNRVPDRPIWEATLAKYSQIACNKPKGNVKLTGITER